MFWDNFVELCNIVNKSANAVCKELNLSNATATHWKKGAMPNDTTLRKIADYFGVTVEQLKSEYTPTAGISSLFRGKGLTEEQKRNILQKTAEAAMREVYEKLGISPIKTKKYRMIGNIACGEPIYAEEEFETYVEASADLNADFCVTAEGDSMINARIFDGDVVFIRQQADVENGEIAAVIIDDSVTLKRVYKYDNRIELRPENPTFRVQNYEGEELERIRILGKAVAFQSIIR